MRPDAPKRPYVPQGELPGSVWRKQNDGRPSANLWLWIGTAVVVTAVLVTVLITLLNASGNNISVMVGLTTATPSATPTNTPTPTITPSPTPVNSDDDALIDDRDNCDFVSNPDQIDTDGDNIGDACDDSDSDTIVDLLDNCPTDANTDQSDLDGDGRGDVCDEAVNLTGITLTLASDAPLYLGSSASSVQVSVEGDASAPLVINASQGGFVASDIGCTSGAPRDYTLRPDETELRYCAPAVSTAQQVRLIIREIGASDQPTGVGGFTTLELQDDVLTPTLAVADVLNPLNATEAGRCIFPDALGDGTLLELDTIPLVFRLNAEANAATERAYTAIVTLPSGGLYIAQGSGSACQLLTPLDPLTGSPAFEAQINTPYVLYYLPGSATGDATQALTISLPGRSIAPVSLNLLPLLVPTIPLNVRDSNLGIAMSLEEGQRALVTGIGGEGINRWAQIRVDGDERELWLNVGQLGGSYRIIGNLESAPQIDLPPNFG